MRVWLRKLGVAVHVVVSVGWLGAVVAFFALALAAQGPDQVVYRAAFVAMDVIGRWVIVPLSLAALLSGIVQSVATKWGLLRHYWVLIKLILTVVAVGAALLHQFTAIEQAARLALLATPAVGGDLHGLSRQLLADAGLALAGLSIITLIAVYKPWGSTPFAKHAAGAQVKRPKSWSLRLFVAAIVALVAAFVASHLSGRSLHDSHSH
jgi:hypothetical protein